MAAFIDAKEDQQTVLLDAIVSAERSIAESSQKGLTYEDTRHYQGFGSYGIQAPGDLGPGIHFFSWIRKMTVDAFYTSEIGIADIGFKGNAVHAKYEVPKEAIEYALKRCPLGKI